MTSKFLLAASLVMAVPVTYAQNAPAPPAPNAPAPVVRSRPQPAPKADRDDRGDRDHGHDHGDRDGDMRGPGGPEGDMLPPGTWWRNPDVAKQIGLTSDQQKRIDDIFLQSRVELIHLHASLEEAQLLLEPLLDANPVDQPKALAQIGKIADTRAELEKTNAKMLLNIRAVLRADQWTKLQAGHRGPRDGREMDGPGGRGGPGGPMGRGPGGLGPPPPPR